MKAALVGVGMVADTHLAALKESKTVDLCGVLGRSGAKANLFATRVAQTLGRPVHAYTAIEEVASDPQVDFAIVATPAERAR
jgi:predicted dehydrogenase